MSEEELKRIIFQAHGQDAKALEFMQTQIAALTAKLEKIKDAVEYMSHTCGQHNNYQCDKCDLDEILREVGQ